MICIPTKKPATTPKVIALHTQYGEIATLITLDGRTYDTIESHSRPHNQQTITTCYMLLRDTDPRNN